MTQWNLLSFYFILYYDFACFYKFALLYMKHSCDLVNMKSLVKY